MKKFFIMGMAAMGLALTACNNDETVDVAKGNAIGFSSFVEKSTRGATDVTLENLENIEVYGWRGDNLIFNAQQVNAKTGAYSPLQYWEAGYTYNFEASAPKNGEKGVTFAANVNGGTITFENDAVTDLLYAKATERTAVKETEAPEKVSFTLNHQLARVKFTFKNTFPETAAAKITVKDVKITNAYKNGTITPAAKNATWTATDQTLAVNFAGNITALAAGGGAAATDHMYLIPTAKEESYIVTFLVTLDQNGATTDYTHSVTVKTTQKQGMSYNYIAEINQNNINPDVDGKLYPIEFTTSVTGWEDWADEPKIMQ